MEQWLAVVDLFQPGEGYYACVVSPEIHLLFSFFSAKQLTVVFELKNRVPYLCRPAKSMSQHYEYNSVTAPKVS